MPKTGKRSIYSPRRTTVSIEEKNLAFGVADSIYETSGRAMPSRKYRRKVFLTALGGWGLLFCSLFGLLLILMTVRA